MCMCQRLSLYIGLSNDVYTSKFMYIKSVSSFVESVHGLNACMSVCACVCVCINHYVCCICIIKTRPMCVHVLTFKL